MISKEMHKTLIRFKIGPSAADVFSSVAAQTDRRPPTRVLKDHSYLFHPGQKLGEVQSRGLSYVKYHLSFLGKNENLIPPRFSWWGVAFPVPVQYAVYQYHSHASRDL